MSDRLEILIVICGLSWSIGGYVFWKWDIGGYRSQWESRKK